MSQRWDILSDLQAAVSEPEQKQPCTRLDSTFAVRRMFCANRSGESVNYSYIFTGTSSKEVYNNHFVIPIEQLISYVFLCTITSKAY